MRILFSIVTLAFAGFGVLAQDVAGNSCKVSGTLRDLQDAIVPNQTVWFSNDNITKKIETDQNGKYALKVDSGKYEVLIGGPFNFWNYRRGIADVTCNADIQLNLYITPECVSYGCSRLGYHFDFFSLSPLKKPVMEMVIAYVERMKKANKLTYRGVVLTTSLTTVSAREIELDAVTSTFVAKDGWIEIEGLRSEFTSLDLKTSLALPTTKPKTLQDQKNVKRLRALYQDLSKQDLK